MSDDVLETETLVNEPEVQEEVSEQALTEETVNESVSPTDEVDHGEDTTAERKNNGVQKRINELVREREDWKRQAQFFAERVRSDEQPQEAPKAKSDAPPKSDDFDSYDEYIDALTDYKTQKAIESQMQGARERRQQAQVQQQEQARVQSIQKTIADGRGKYDDFDAVALSGTSPITDYMASAIAESDIGADLAYYLGKNPDQAQQIAEMSPTASIRAIGKLEAKVEAQLVQSKEKSNAPAPIKPVSKGAKANVDPDSMSIDEWMKWRQSKVS